MKQLFITLIAISTCFSLQAQDYKLAKSSGKLLINLPGATIEGHSGNEIIITGANGNREEDERAKGLRAINGSGLEDNTGFGVNVSDKGNTVEITQVGKRELNSLIIKVPKGIVVAYNFDKAINAGKVRFRNIDNELEVSVMYNSVDLENVSGPMTVKSVYGGIDAELGANLKSPISIVSVYGHVDVAMPVTTKANMNLSSPMGEIFASPDFKIEVEKSGNSDLVKLNDQIKGKLNGGGGEISLKSNWGKIYLRKR